ncbi:VOC family protein [Cryobacterium suzukii]|uniref:VOC family protein n=1 Tax=Cryobacterium suzukii TaxID=1259198 RepID=A0A4R9AHH0_9MICO|nr:VOC family protein [Cryobacterium suzukii]TFD62173.1 VOC family protein [Cryobacterium suzukii]
MTPQRISKTRFLFAEVFGFHLRFQDGERIALLKNGEVSVALSAGEEDIAVAVAIPIVVIDLAQALDRALSAGAELVSSPKRGPHGLRAVVKDVTGNA